MGVATAVAIGGLAISAATTTNSFIQAGKQKKKQREAERAAERAMAEVRKQLSVNYFDKVAIKKEPYELQREAALSQGAMAIQAGQESDRGAAPTAGRVQMAQNEAQAGIRTAMGEKMDVIEQQAIEEDIRLRDLNAQLTLGQIEGAQMAAANAEEAAAIANQQGFQGVASTLEQGLAMVPLFTNEDIITTSGGDSGPGANAAFQSPIGDRYSNRGSIPESLSSNVVAGASARRQNPFTNYYPKGYKPGLEYSSEANNQMPSVNQFAPNPNYYTRRYNTGLGYGMDFSSVGGY
jgi:hypothetical protein